MPGSAGRLVPLSFLDEKVLAASGEPGLPRLILLGLAAAALFSATFVLNRAISLAGGPWAWNAALRYLDMAVLMAGWIAWRGGPARLRAVLSLFRRRWRYWLLAGGIGFGVFYAGICFAADRAPGWIVAASWQLTILASPIVLRGFGRVVPLRGVMFALLIAAGVGILNAHLLAAQTGWAGLAAGLLPVLAAAFAYPFGAQMLNRARHAGGADGALLADPACGVLLLTLGSLPVFALLLAITTPRLPGPGQILATLAVAVISGCCATTLFLYTRNLSADPYRIAAVDATQAGEVVFALAGEMSVLGAPPPDALGWLGLGAVVLGLVGLTARPAARRD